MKKMILKKDFKDTDKIKCNSLQIRSYFIVILGLCLVLLSITSSCISSYVGYNGYHQDTFHRVSRSLQESKDRQVYFKSLRIVVLSNDSGVRFKNDTNYKHLEYSYRWGKYSSYKTRIDSSSQFSLQFVYEDVIIDKNISLRLHYNYLYVSDSTIKKSTGHTRIDKNRNFSKPIYVNIVDKYNNIHARLMLVED